MGPAHPVLLALASGVVGCTGGLWGWLQGVLRPLGISPGLYTPSPALFYILPKFTHLAIMYLNRSCGGPQRRFTLQASLQQASDLQLRIPLLHHAHVMMHTAQLQCRLGVGCRLAWLLNCSITSQICPMLLGRRKALQKPAK